ncbi:MAG TPA: hypothetical protein VFP68_20560 [Burkholderiaceae bacterium]|nr:hypothetical protein [Burkholderiaceae bacterium]
MSGMAGMVIAMVMGTAMQASPFPPVFDDAVAHSRVMNAGYVVEATQRYSALRDDSREELTRRLEELARLPATAEGVNSALAPLTRQVESFPQGEQPKEGSGRPAGQQAMHSAGMCLIHGRLAEAADEANRSVQTAAALVRVIQDAPALSDRDREFLLRELEQSFGRELYAKALKDASSRKGSKP